MWREVTEGPPTGLNRSQLEPKSLSLSLPGQERRANPDPSARGRAPAGQGGVFKTPPEGYAHWRLGCTKSSVKKSPLRICSNTTNSEV